MRIAFFVNSIDSETPSFTTTVLAMAAMARGHDVVDVEPGDFVLRPDNSLLVRSVAMPSATYKKAETFYAELQRPPPIRKSSIRARSTPFCCATTRRSTGPTDHGPHMPG